MYELGGDRDVSQGCRGRAGPRTYLAMVSRVARPEAMMKAEMTKPKYCEVRATRGKSATERLNVNHPSRTHLLVVRARPEGEGASSVEGEAHDDTLLVAEARGEHGCGLQTKWSWSDCRSRRAEDPQQARTIETTAYAPK